MHFFHRRDLNFQPRHLLLTTPEDDVGSWRVLWRVNACQHAKNRSALHVRMACALITYIKVNIQRFVTSGDITCTFVRSFVSGAVLRSQVGGLLLAPPELLIAVINQFSRQTDIWNYCTVAESDLTVSQTFLDGLAGIRSLSVDVCNLVLLRI